MRIPVNFYNTARRLFLTTQIIFLLAGFSGIRAQEPPPRPIRVEVTAQSLSFGAFYQGIAGGTVVINPSGARSSTGDIVLLGLGYSFSAALLEVHAQRGTVISILNGPDATLSGTPSGSMSLHIGNSLPASPFVSTSPFSVAQPLYIGGTLTVGSPAANPPGSYTGTFEITFVQE